MRNSIYKVIITWMILLVPFSWIEAQVSDDVFSRECENALRLSLAQRYDEAIPVYERIIATLKNQNDAPDLIAMWLKGLGTCKLYTGKTGDAEALYFEALNLLNSPEYANHKLVRQLYDALAVLYVQTHN